MHAAATAVTTLAYNIRLSNHEKTSSGICDLSMNHEENKEMEGHTIY